MPAGVHGRTCRVLHPLATSMKIRLCSCHQLNITVTEDRWRNCCTAMKSCWLSQSALISSLANRTLLILVSISCRHPVIQTSDRSRCFSVGVADSSVHRASRAPLCDGVRSTTLFDRRSDVSCLSEDSSVQSELNCVGWRHIPDIDTPLTYCSANNASHNVTMFLQQIRRKNILHSIVYTGTIYLSKRKLHVSRELRFLMPKTGSQLTAIFYQHLAKCSGVTRTGDTRGGKWGCHPSIFSWKTWRPFFCSSLSLSLSLFVAFTRVSPTPTPFYLSDLVSPLFCKFAHKMFSFGCHPLEGVTGGGPPSPAPT